MAVEDGGLAPRRPMLPLVGLFGRPESTWRRRDLSHCVCGEVRELRNPEAVAVTRECFAAACGSISWATSASLGRPKEEPTKPAP